MRHSMRRLCALRHMLGVTHDLVCLAWCVVLLAACSFPGSVKPTIKIGLAAPFEGRYRDLGYEVLHAVQLAVKQRNDAGGVGRRYLVELVALNDYNEAEEAVVQARKMAIDPGVLGVVAGLSHETAQAAATEYTQLGLAFLIPGTDLTQPQSSLRSELGFEADYKALSGGVPPGQAAAWAYAEANRLLDALDAAVRSEDQPSRQGVQAALMAGR